MTAGLSPFLACSGLVAFTIVSQSVFVGLSAVAGPSPCFRADLAATATDPATGAPVMLASPTAHQRPGPRHG